MEYETFLICNQSLLNNQKSYHIKWENLMEWFSNKKVEPDHYYNDW